MAPLAGSEAMLTGAVLSTRAISTSAGRGPPFGSKCWVVWEMSDWVCCGTSRRIGLQLMVHDLAVEGEFD
jgi:hypothetical protein